MGRQETKVRIQKYLVYADSGAGKDADTDAETGGDTHADTDEDAYTDARR